MKRVGEGEICGLGVDGDLSQAFAVRAGCGYGDWAYGGVGWWFGMAV